MNKKLVIIGVSSLIVGFSTVLLIPKFITKPKQSSYGTESVNGKMNAFWRGKIAGKQVEYRQELGQLSEGMAGSAGVFNMYRYTIAYNKEFSSIIIKVYRGTKIIQSESYKIQ